MASFAALARLSTRSFLARVPRAQMMSTIKFSPSHEYIQIDGDVGTVGITAHAADALGDVVFVDLPSVGDKFVVGDSFGSVESVKAASDVYSPVEGEVVEVNSVLDSEPGTVNESALEKGWFMKLKITDTAGLDDLMDQPTYDQHCVEEA
eukprot:CAMPEP_0181290772 /NCGR_PEP_ID=MMETSP1101-20121128/1592_1 /TAXON_ID=46948 /ORGANISM="Rhodomonas abbreviata, Strain Caron Lab Isolate" /LENGTH=149 /DNA_ID=CAMNT_0023395079 /DNA_START=42 /DNA_END=491 /DNA_ORIENTATION=+